MKYLLLACLVILSGCASTNHNPPTFNTSGFPDQWPAYRADMHTMYRTLPFPVK